MQNPIDLVGIKSYNHDIDENTLKGTDDENYFSPSYKQYDVLLSDAKLPGTMYDRGLVIGWHAPRYTSESDP